MKIEEVVQHPPVQVIQKKGTTVEGKEGDFRRLLEDAKARSPEHSQTVSSPLSSPGMEKTSGPAYLTASIEAALKTGDLSGIRSQGIKAAENALGILEAYQHALGDPRTTLRQLEPLVHSMSQEMNHLNLLTEKMSPSDPLRRIVTELGIVSSVEIEKFDRGEYV